MGWAPLSFPLLIGVERSPNKLNFYNNGRNGVGFGLGKQRIDEINSILLHKSIHKSFINQISFNLFILLFIDFFRCAQSPLGLHSTQPQKQSICSFLLKLNDFVGLLHRSPLVSFLGWLPAACSRP